jgi:hypothetical protein
MKNINVDWNLSPKGATELVKVALIGQKWRNSKNKQYWDMNGDFAGHYGEGSPIDEAEVFATRPQPKTVADDQEGEKWTHVIKATKEKCRITEGPNDAGQVFIKTEEKLWDCLYIEQLKPIKPKLTDKQYNACAAMASRFNIDPNEFEEYMSKFDIAEGPAND